MRTKDQLQATKENFAIWVLRSFIGRLWVIEAALPKRAVKPLRDEIVQAIVEIKERQKARNPRHNVKPL